MTELEKKLADFEANGYKLIDQRETEGLKGDKYITVSFYDSSDIVVLVRARETAGGDLIKYNEVFSSIHELKKIIKIIEG